MKKLKDFIYDYNDVLVALVIVLVAGLIIFWRVNAVLDYPEYLSSKQEVQQLDIDFSGIDLTQEKVDENPIEPEIEPDPVEEPQPAVCEHVYENGVCTKCGESDPNYVEPQPQPQIKTFTIEVSKTKGTATWTACGKVLEENGIVSGDDKYTGTQLFVARVVARKLESALQPGKYDVNSGMTLDEIINILIKK